MSKIRPVVSGVLMWHTAMFAQEATSEENAAIKRTALDYIEGWYAGDAARMGSSQTR